MSEPTNEPITPAPTPAPADNGYDETTRRRLMYLLISGFYIYSSGLAYLISGKTGYELSSAAQAIIVMTLTAMISGVGLATGYYYGTTMKAKQDTKP